MMKKNPQPTEKSTHLKDVSSNYISLFHSRIKATKIVKTCSLVFVLCVSEYIEQFVFA